MSETNSTISHDPDFEASLRMTARMLIINIHDMTKVAKLIAERYQGSEDISEFLLCMASVSNRISRTAVEIMPEQVRKQLEEYFSGGPWELEDGPEGATRASPGGRAVAPKLMEWATTSAAPEEIGHQSE
jgi:hypothetical protein